MRHSLNAVDYSTFIQNLLLSSSLIIGGIWAWYKFRRRKEIASLSVKIEKVEICKSADKTFLMSVEVFIRNIGDREVKLYYNFTPKKDTKTKFEELNKQYKANMKLYRVMDDRILTFISQKEGLSSDSDHFTARLRSKVSCRLPYIFKIVKPGMYFLEFCIHINMQSYFKPEDGNKNPIKIWSDRRYYNISEFDNKTK